ncbi:hypothetical protein TRIUR3_21093 [Triticum urartu]|uniref:Uncharacterized protein n=1 Tax=Triticum urartu TaxID=4572 RepID=M8AIU5_TRIUA|nr:hypothetical protein TRIUR3_21093 [Triticum urartu]
MSVTRQKRGNMHRQFGLEADKGASHTSQAFIHGVIGSAVIPLKCAVRDGASRVILYLAFGVVVVTAPYVVVFGDLDESKGLGGGHGTPRWHRGGIAVAACGRCTSTTDTMAVRRGSGARPAARHAQTSRGPRAREEALPGGYGCGRGGGSRGTPARKETVRWTRGRWTWRFPTAVISGADAGDSGRRPSAAGAEEARQARRRPGLAGQWGTKGGEPEKEGRRGGGKVVGRDGKAVGWSSGSGMATLSHDSSERRDRVRCAAPLRTVKAAQEGDEWEKERGSI